jgi:ribosomal protein L11 methyltransferase
MSYCEVRFTLIPLLPAREVLMAELAECGFESFVEHDDGLSGYIQNESFSEEMITSLMAADIPEQQLSYTVNIIEDENWNAVWESSFEPIIVDDKCMIRAPFHAHFETFEYDIVIEPKMSFGTGHHDTTHLIISRMMTLDFRDKHVLDMGCGTGVLAILAEKMGASGGEAIDIDEWAHENTRENFSRNDCQRFITIKGGAEAIPSVKYDVILANINRNILTRDMQSYVDVLQLGGLILFSGFYETDFNEIDKCAISFGLKLSSRQVKNEWCMLEYTK